ncbi:carbohydrate ABC transporter permease [Oceanobacillus neutriphilus]|nr:sugar ABC transporter permease [Oceanobacillus neutriphilus]
MNTIYFIFIGTPLVVAFQLATAMVLNNEVKGINFFRTLYYLPYLVPTVATVVIWIILYGKTGVINQIIGVVGLGPYEWTGDVHLIKPVIITMGMWAVGNGFLIFLAGLKGVPTHLYEAAKIDGAGSFRQFIHITLPMITPTILFNLIMQCIQYFQMFTESYVLNKGGPDYASTTYLLNTYNTAFKDFDFGLAMAQSWILFIIIFLITFAIMKTSDNWVYYESDKGR